MGLRKIYRTDAEKEVSGVWQDVAINDHNGKPIRIHIARASASNKAYAKALEAATKPHQAAIQNDALDNELGKKLLQGVFCDTLLLDWDNVPRSEWTGNEADVELVPYSKDEALELFAILPDLYLDWSGRTEKAAAFRETLREEAAKN